MKPPGVGVERRNGGSRFRYNLVRRHQTSHEHPMSHVTRILSAIEQGDGQAAEELMPLVQAHCRILSNVVKRYAD